ncbi:MAG: hypothetical protein RL661_760 [Pseudomonadota bacterium]|jgi:hypothetical protein
MANGFAMRGFTQGFTQGLQNVNDLYNSYVDRDLRRAEAERLRGVQDLQNRASELKLQAGDLELAKARRDEELAKKQADYPRIYGIINKQGDFTDEDLQTLHDYGLGTMLSGEDESDNLMKLANEVRSGRRNAEDPEVAQKLLPALQPMMNRDIGGIGRDPRTGQPVRIAAKVPTGFLNVNGKVVPMLSVRGAGQDGQYIEYEAPATQFGSSLPDDPLLALTNERAASKLEGAARLNRQIAQNPELRTRLQEYAGVLANGVPKPISAKDQAYILDKESQIGSRQINDAIKQKQLEIDSKTGLAKVEAERELAALRREKQATEQTVQDKNLASLDGKQGKQKSLDLKRVNQLADSYYPIPKKPAAFPPDDPLGQSWQKQAEEATTKRQEYIRTVQGLVTVSGMDQDQAAHAAASGQQELFNAKDGHTYWVVNTFDKNGKAIKVPFAQVK